MVWILPPRKVLLAKTLIPVLLVDAPHMFKLPVAVMLLPTEMPTFDPAPEDPTVIAPEVALIVPPVLSIETLRPLMAAVFEIVPPVDCKTMLLPVVVIAALTEMLLAADKVKVGLVAPA